MVFGSMPPATGMLITIGATMRGKVLVQIDAVSKTSPINKETLFIERGRIPA
jgi:hypothetical protein